MTPTERATGRATGRATDCAPARRTTGWHGLLRWLLVGIGGGLLMLLAACGDDGDPAPAPDASATPAGVDAAPADAIAPALVHLQQDYELLDAAHRVMSNIWEGLATGASAQCGTYPDLPDPGGITDEGDERYTALADTLRSAAINLDESVRLWRAECSNPRANPPPDVVNEGRLRTRTAGDALAAAQNALRAIQSGAEE